MRFVVTLFLFLIPISGFAQVSLQDKIAQMIMVAFTTSQASKDSLLFDIANRNLGGILLFKYNLVNPTQMKALTDELQVSANTPLFLATDQEGGRVARLDGTNGFESTYNHYTLGTTYNREDYTRGVAAKMGDWLNQVGINVNLAPVVDVNVNPQSPAIGALNRSFSSDPNRVVQHAGYFIDEMNTRSIATALKHYPGHGSALSDSHYGFTDISNTWQEYELTPFRDLIANGYSDMIMTGHLFKSDWDEMYPASISKHAITTILRDSLGFEGVVISDELFMQAISDNFGFDEAVVQAIRAGSDILLFNKNILNNRSLVYHIIETVTLAIEFGELDESLIDDAYNRIQTLKNERIITSNDEEQQLELPSEILISNYPNPFNPSTQVLLTVPESGSYSVRVFNTLGQQVANLHQGNLKAGTVSFQFDGSGLASGVYLVITQSTTLQNVHKISLIK
ncbi:glycoside hydrolase family 3 protein [bacterium]|nr:MAG: glycoside hydrolase family 3 protein [bacterium]